MIEATAQSRMAIADKTQARRDGKYHKYAKGDLIYFYREPNGVHTKDQSVWRGPATIVDLTTLDEGTTSVKWNGRYILTSIRTTRPHISYPILVMLSTPSES